MSKCIPFKFPNCHVSGFLFLLLNLWNTNFNIKSPIVFVFGFKHYKFLNTDILFFLVFSFYNFRYKICSHEPNFILFPVFFRKLWHMVSMAQDTVMLDMCFKFPWRMLIYCKTCWSKTLYLPSGMNYPMGDQFLYFVF